MGSVYTTMKNTIMSKQQKRILMVGLDAGGKTTILYRLKLGETIPVLPKLAFGVETVEYKNFNFTVWDLNGQHNLRNLWRHYYQNTQGIVFVIDSNDRDQFGEAREELGRMLNEEELRDVVLLIFANKQDLPQAMRAAEITEQLNVYLADRKFLVQPCCAFTGEGLYEGFDWLATNL